MTIKSSQLDELEQKAKLAKDIALVPLEGLIALMSFREASEPDVTLHLVAVYRAALAWSESRMVPGVAAEREAAHALIAALR